MVTNRQASLTIRGGPRDGLAIPLGRLPIVLGRRPNNDVVIDDATVSRRHGLIMETPHGFVLHDLGSANGTSVNGGKIGDVPHLLRNWASIRLGASEVTLVFRQEAATTVVLRSDRTASPA